jgi:hypothetical protein
MLAFPRPMQAATDRGNPMTELAKIVTHYLEAIVKQTKLRGFDEMRAEIEAADAADEREWNRPHDDDVRIGHIEGE